MSVVCLKELLMIKYPPVKSPIWGGLQLSYMGPLVQITFPRRVIRKPCPWVSSLGSRKARRGSVLKILALLFVPRGRLANVLILKQMLRAGAAHQAQPIGHSRAFQGAIPTSVLKRLVHGREGCKQACEVVLPQTDTAQFPLRERLWGFGREGLALCFSRQFCSKHL